ncbi:hypothetical protein LENED_004937 [Lentinula edodes]|uniref:Uncharacterized protein n=1 Tax=Lentinula edodes TaxID=5353 RepID=A0A1Q3E7M8_LENED|nr:hypothetical protein LENED_004937 [Lentinula edodes]
MLFYAIYVVVEIKLPRRSYQQRYCVVGFDFSKLLGENAPRWFTHSQPTYAFEAMLCSDAWELRQEMRWYRMPFRTVSHKTKQAVGTSEQRTSFPIQEYR